MKIHVITPVKDSWETTKLVIEQVSRSMTQHDFSYTIYNDFSTPENCVNLAEITKKYGFNLVNLADITNTPSPNYRLVLQHAQQRALEENAYLMIIESDVIIKENTIEQLGNYVANLDNPGMVGAVTVDREEKINYPYLYALGKEHQILNTRKRITFCCTILSVNLLKTIDFRCLDSKKSWFDVFVSHESLKRGFNNYLLTLVTAIHLPHSSRPWKQVKYQNKLKYYLLKYYKRRDKI